MTLSRRSYVVVSLVIFAVALALRIGVTSAFVGLDAAPDGEAFTDQVDYERYAYELSIGNGYAEPDGKPGIRRAPGTSFALLPAYLVFGHSLAAGRLWLCLLSALTCLATAWLARQCFGPWVGLLAAGWLAVYPGHFYHAMHFMSETPFGLSLALALGFTVRAMQQRSRWSDVLAGAFWGLTVLTRPGVLLVVPVALFVALFASDRAYQLRRLAIQCVALGLVIAPWVVRNAIVFGAPMMTTVGGHTFYGANNETCLNDPYLAGKWIPTSDLHTPERPITGNELERERAAWRYGWQFVGENLGQLPYLTMMKLYRLAKPVHATPNMVIWWTFTIGWFSAVPFLLVGLAVAWRRKRTQTLILLLPMLALVVQTVVFYGIGRFRDARAPAFLPLAALGLAIVLVRFFPRVMVAESGTGDGFGQGFGHGHDGIEERPQK